MVNRRSEIMNFIFISPQFPKTYWQFCAGLKINGVNVLGIGDTPYDLLSPSLKMNLNEYYKVDNLANYDEIFKAVAFFSFKYGKIDYIESNNEYWLEQDARIRKDFNIITGLNSDDILRYKSKFLMKEYYKMANIPIARYEMVTNYENALDFISQVNYPIMIKPDKGVGAAKTYKIVDQNSLKAFFNIERNEPYIMEEYIDGAIVSFDGVVDSKSNPVFCASNEFPFSIADIVNNKSDLAYYTNKFVPVELEEAGRRVLKAFGAKRRFFHLEFFRLASEHAELGKKGDYVALEVNMRPAGGYTPDMIDYANSINIYQVWADVIAFDENRQQSSYDKYYCSFVSRRDIHSYVHSDAEILKNYGRNIMMKEKMPEVLTSAMGNDVYIARFDTLEEHLEFVKFALQLQEKIPCD